ncbi:MAG: prolipoprotein diacylglyceryl transferase [bacterium]|nr:prolipoprotein diacylglyceryl transferase [bacterium]
MLPQLIGIGPINIPTFGIFAAISFVAFSFTLWRNLRDDYLEEDILTFTILAAVFFLLGGRILYLVDHFFEFGSNILSWLLFPLYPGFSMVGAFLGASLFTYFWATNKKWNFWVIADTAILSFLAVVLICLLGYVFIQGLNTALLIQVLLTILALAAYFLLKNTYRKFIWYKSGKPGFTATTITAIYFLGLFGLDLYTRSVLYFHLLATLATVVVALFFLYKLSGRKLKEDLSGLPKIVIKLPIRK